VDYKEFKRHLGKAGLTVNSFAELLGVQPSSVSNYAKKNRVPQAYALVATLAGEIVDGGDNLKEILRKHGVANPPADGSAVVMALDAFRHR
jgi:predicted transcriptional regulator